MTTVCTAVGSALAWLPAVLAVALIGDAAIFIGAALIVRRRRKS